MNYSTDSRVAEIVGVVEQVWDVELVDIPQLVDLGEPIEQGSEVVDFVFHALIHVEHVLLDRFEHAVEPPQHRQRQNDLAILRLLVVTSQQVSYRPDKRRMILYRCRIAVRHARHPATRVR